MSAIALLRQRTAHAHESVDARFAKFDLADRESYRDFLTAHARALPGAERAVAAIYRPFRSRYRALAADIAALDGTMPPPFDHESASEAANWGALYVVEGSRLGGGMLARQVPENLPHSYLAAVHLTGEWREIRAAIDHAAEGKDAAWHEELVTGALAVFELYGGAATT